MSSKIVKPLQPGITVLDIDNRKFTGNFCSWERLLPAIGEAAALKPGESVAGIIITDRGIDIQIRKYVPKKGDAVRTPYGDATVSSVDNVDQAVRVKYTGALSSPITDFRFSDLTPLDHEKQ